MVKPGGGADFRKIQAGASMDTEMAFTVLIVEDNPTVMKMLVENFIRRGDKVVESVDGLDLVNLIESEEPDIIILDIMLPYKDGFTLLREMREADIDLPVLMLTEKSEIDDKVQGLETGADDYITKPFSFRELYARIRSNLRRKGGLSKVVNIGELRIDRSARSAKYRGLPLESLTKTEFDLLLYLSETIPRVASHGELLEKVLGYSADAETKALVMHIANLRRKLKLNELEETVLINSVPGIGYRLEIR